MIQNHFKSHMISWNRFYHWFGRFFRKRFRETGPTIGLDSFLTKTWFTETVLSTGFEACLIETWIRAPMQVRSKRFSALLERLPRLRDEMDKGVIRLVPRQSPLLFFQLLLVFGQMEDVTVHVRIGPRASLVHKQRNSNSKSERRRKTNWIQRERCTREQENNNNVEPT